MIKVDTYRRESEMSFEGPQAVGTNKSDLSLYENHPWYHQVAMHMLETACISLQQNNQKSRSFDQNNHSEKGHQQHYPLDTPAKNTSEEEFIFSNLASLFQQQVTIHHWQTSIQFPLKRKGTVSVLEEFI